MKKYIYKNIYKNKKNGKLYKVLYHGYDVTNIRHGEPVVVYCLFAEDEPVIFTRNEEEFKNKFERI